MRDGRVLAALALLTLVVAWPSVAVAQDPLDQGTIQVTATVEPYAEVTVDPDSWSVSYEVVDWHSWLPDRFDSVLPPGDLPWIYGWLGGWPWNVDQRFTVRTNTPVSLQMSGGAYQEGQVDALYVFWRPTGLLGKVISHWSGDPGPFDTIDEPSDGTEYRFFLSGFAVDDLSTVEAGTMSTTLTLTVSGQGS